MGPKPRKIKCFHPHIREDIPNTNELTVVHYEPGTGVEAYTCYCSKCKHLFVLHFFRYENNVNAAFDGDMWEEHFSSAMERRVKRWYKDKIENIESYKSSW